MCFYKHLVPQPYRVFIEIYKSGVEIMKGTIYKIESKVNGKVYIGMTTRNIEIRWYEHKTELIRNKHHNIKLQRHYNKYGDVFNYSIIEELEFEDEEIFSVERGDLRDLRVREHDEVLGAISISRPRRPAETNTVE